MVISAVVTLPLKCHRQGKRSHFKLLIVVQENVGENGKLLVGGSRNRSDVKAQKGVGGGEGGSVSRIWLVFGSVFRFPHSKPEVFRFLCFARFADFLPI